MRIASLFESHSPIDSASWIQPLIQNQLAGYAYGKWRDQLSESDEHLLRPHWKLQLARNQSYLNILDELSPKLKRDGISICLLKGMSLLGSVYGDPGMRSMMDIDVLCPVDQKDGFLNILREMGFTDFGAQNWKYNHYKDLFLLKDPHFPIFFEVHTQLFEHVPMPNLAEWEEWRKPGIYTLRKPVLCAHLIGHYFFQHTCLSVYWLVDIILMVRSLSPQELLEAEMLCQKWKLGKNWAALQQIFNLIGQVPNNPTSRIFAQLITDKFLWAPKSKLHNYFLLKHLLKDSFWDSVSYNFHWLWKNSWMAKK